MGLREGLQSVILAFPGHTHLHSNAKKYLHFPTENNHIPRKKKTIQIQHCKTGSLISLFQDIVFRIWVNYLSKLGVAFSDGPKLVELEKYEPQR